MRYRVTLAFTRGRFQGIEFHVCICVRASIRPRIPLAPDAPIRLSDRFLKVKCLIFIE
jgi:hypothetical protein